MTKLEEDILDKAFDYSNEYGTDNLTKEQVVRVWLSAMFWLLTMVIRHRKRLTLEQWLQMVKNIGAHLGYTEGKID